MLDTLQSKYDGQFETKRRNMGSENSLMIGSDSDDWVIVLQQTGGVFKIMYKEDGYTGSPEKSITAGENDVESSVAEFVEYL